MIQKLVDGLVEQADADDPMPEATTVQAAAEAKVLRDAVLVGLAELIDKGHVELVPDATEAAADELTLAALDARNPRHTLKKLRTALLDSDHVEEVYADDRVLEAAFRRAMGG